MDGRITMLLGLVDQAYNVHAWHGTNLRGSLRGISLEEALWRPGPDRHNIWETVLHTAYWKFCVRRHLSGQREERFPRPGSNWPTLPEPALLAAYKSDVALLAREHRALRLAIAEFPAARLGKTPSGLKWRYEQYIQGIASHDLYHAGQIQLLKRLMRQG